MDDLISLIRQHQKDLTYRVIQYAGLFNCYRQEYLKQELCDCLITPFIRWMMRYLLSYVTYNNKGNLEIQYSPRAFSDLWDILEPGRKTLGWTSFLALQKFYHRSFRELVLEEDLDSDITKFFLHVLDEIFDMIEWDTNQRITA